MHENNNRNNYTNNSIAVDAAVAAGSTHATQLTLNWQQRQQPMLHFALPLVLFPTPFMCAIMQIKYFLYPCICVCACKILTQIFCRHAIFMLYQQLQHQQQQQQQK